MACLLPLGMQAQQGTFRFAQLTDIHLTPNNPNPTEDLLRSVAQINATDSIDFVLVTGDLTEEGDRTTMEKVKSCLDLLKVPYHVVLGNHETKWSDSGCTAFGEIFGGERFEFEHKGFLFLGFNSGPLMRMAYGHVVPQDIRWMTEEMDKNGKDKPVILVTHYPLMEGDVDNWYEVTEAFLEKIHADDGILVNLASSEMKRLFDWKRIRREARIITPEFRIREGDRLKTIVVYTKMCRGEMTRHLIRNRIADPEMLKEFEWEGFRFDAALSRGDDWTFTM